MFVLLWCGVLVYLFPPFYFQELETFGSEVKVDIVFSLVGVVRNLNCMCSIYFSCYIHVQGIMCNPFVLLCLLSSVVLTLDVWDIFLQGSNVNTS